VASFASIFLDLFYDWVKQTFSFDKLCNSGGGMNIMLTLIRCHTSKVNNLIPHTLLYVWCVNIKMCHIKLKNA